MKCHLCDSPNARLIKYDSGHVLVQCEECTILGGQANLERIRYSDEMSILKPETFRNKPSCSKIWLMAYCKTATMTCH